MYYKLFFWILVTLSITFIVFLFNEPQWINFINIIFITATILTSILFVILLAQEGIFDVSSYGFRKLKYHFSFSKTKARQSNDEFFNPRHVKKEYYNVSSWVKLGLIVNLTYVVLAIIFSYILIK